MPAHLPYKGSEVARRGWQTLPIESSGQRPTRATQHWENMLPKAAWPFCRGTPDLFPDSIAGGMVSINAKVEAPVQNICTSTRKTISCTGEVGLLQ